MNGEFPIQFKCHKCSVLLHGGVKHDCGAPDNNSGAPSSVRKLKCEKTILPNKTLLQIRACRKAIQFSLPFQQLYASDSSVVTINHRFIFVKEDFQVCLTLQFNFSEKFCSIRMYPTKYSKQEELIFNIKPMPLFNLEAWVKNKNCETIPFRNKYRLVNKLVINFPKADFLVFAHPFKQTGAIPVFVRLQHFVKIK